MRMNILMGGGVKMLQWQALQHDIAKQKWIITIYISLLSSKSKTNESAEGEISTLFSLSLLILLIIESAHLAHIQVSISPY